MNVAKLMTKPAISCRAGDHLDDAARIMWDNDCGCVPVTDGHDHVVGMLTDRDVCMAAYLQGRPISQILVSTAMTSQVVTLREDDDIAAAETLMQRKQLRRLPVLDPLGRLKGILSINDLARHHHPPRGLDGDRLGDDVIATTLAEICEHRRAPASGEIC